MCVFAAGGPGQLPHLAPTYAAVLALCTIGSEQAYSAIDRPGLQRFLYHCHQDDGSFIMHQDGEVDIRCELCGVEYVRVCGVWRCREGETVVAE